MNHLQTVELPDLAVIAHQLAAVANALPGTECADRDSLRNVAELLHSTQPNVEAAHAQALHALACAFEADAEGVRAETWLLCAAAALLTQALQVPVMPLPQAAELLAWCDALQETQPQRRGWSATAQRGAQGKPQLRALGQWLQEALAARLRADSGEL